MSVWAVIKVLAGMVVLSVMGFTSWAVWQVHDEVLEPRQAEGRLVELLDGGGGPEVEPGDRAFRRAVELIALDKADQAREKLLYVVNFHPGSPSAPEAKRILGEMNLDEMLSTESMEGKVVYKVRPGDSFLGIAAKHRTSLDCLIHLNGLMDLNRLHPGDELIVMPLDLRVVIDPAGSTLTLWDEGRFLKEYPLLACDTGAVTGPVTLKIEGKTGLVGTKRVPPATPEYRASDKLLTLGRGIVIRGVPEDGDPAGRGIFLARPDAEELALVLRVGNEVEIRAVSP